MGWDNVDGMATRYVLDGPGIESRWGRGFTHLTRRALGPTLSAVKLIPGFFPILNPPPSSAVVKQEVVIYPLLPLTAFMASSRVELTLC